MQSTGGCLALIPARGGSKGIPHKNLAPGGGRPLIAWTVAAARAAGPVDRVVVSTDDAVIAAVGRELGAEIPFLRPAELAQDDTPGIAPPLHALRWLEKHEGYRPALLLLLQPTSPLRTAEDIRAAVELLQARDADAVVSVTPVRKHPHWMKRLGAEGRLIDAPALAHGLEAVPQRGGTRRQDLPPLYAPNGAVYLARRDVLLDHGGWYTERTYAYVMPEERSLDIDTPWDLHLADLVLGGRHAAA